MSGRSHERLDCSEWEHLLGIWPDYRISKTFGVSRCTLGKYRKKRGIKAVVGRGQSLDPRYNEYNKTDWAALFKTGKNNTEIARVVGCSIVTVAEYRRKVCPNKPLSMRALKQTSAKDKIFEIAELLGKCSDRSLSKRMDLSPITVARYRRELGIPVYKKVLIILPKRSPQEVTQDRQRGRFEELFTSKGYSVDDVIAATDCLTDRESDIFIARYGLHGCGACTLKKVGDRYELSRERIRQLEEQATWKVIRTLKSNKEAP